jgi:hypothetical protein
LNKNKYILSLSLAAISLIILVGILFYWNINNYQKEKTELFDKIKNQLDLVIGDFNDSIFVTFIDDIQADPTANVSTLIKSYGFLADTLNDVDWTIDPNLQIESHEIEINVNDRTSGLIIEMKQEDHDDSIVFERIERFPKSLNRDIKSKITFEKSLSHKDSLVTSVTKKHIAQERFTIKDSIIDTLSKQENEHILYTNRFNKSIQRRFIHRLDSLKINIPFNSEELKTSNNITKSFNIDNAFYSQNYKLSFFNYKWFVIKQIIPNVFLSSLVVSMMFLSFFFMFYHWKKQSDLIKFKNEFMSNMTHELKTPISTVGVAIEAISDFGFDKNPSKRREYLDIAKHEVSRLNLLVDKVLKMTAFDEQVETLNKQSLDLNTLCASVIKSLKLHFEKHQVTLDYMPSKNVALIQADKVHLSNVIYNIIDNAIKYSGEAPEISISIYPTSAYWNVQISDKGQGIESKHLDKVFDRFFRATQDDIHDVKGYGLGLNYAKDIIEKHEGILNIKSEINKGTTVTIKLKK